LKTVKVCDDPNRRLEHERELEQERGQELEQVIHLDAAALKIILSEIEDIVQELRELRGTLERPIVVRVEEVPENNPKGEVQRADHRRL
jgi:hypothetical protein